MDRFFFGRRGSNTQPTSRRVPAGMQIFHGILNLLAVLIRFPTEEEQQAAGIFLGNKDYK
jgi:hypothetical protein